MVGSGDDGKRCGDEDEVMMMMTTSAVRLDFMLQQNCEQTASTSFQLKATEGEIHVSSWRVPSPLHAGSTKDAGYLPISSSGCPCRTGLLRQSWLGKVRC